MSTWYSRARFVRRRTMSIWYSRRKKEEKSLRLAAAGKSAFCFAELHYNARSLTHAAGVAVERALRLYRKIDRKR